MSELVITSKEELEKILQNIVSQIAKSLPGNSTDDEQKLNQKQAAAFLGITQSTLIRWKKNGRVPYEQLPGSTKITYYKSQLKAVIQRNPGLLQAARK